MRQVGYEFFRFEIGIGFLRQVGRCVNICIREGLAEYGGQTFGASCYHKRVMDYGNPFVWQKFGHNRSFHLWHRNLKPNILLQCCLELTILYTQEY